MFGLRSCVLAALVWIPLVSCATDTATLPDDDPAVDTSGESFPGGPRDETGQAVVPEEHWYGHGGDGSGGNDSGGSDGSGGNDSGGGSGSGGNDSGGGSGSGGNDSGGGSGSDGGGGGVDAGVDGGGSGSGSGSGSDGGCT